MIVTEYIFLSSFTKAQQPCQQFPQLDAFYLTFCSILTISNSFNQTIFKFTNESKYIAAGLY